MPRTVVGKCCVCGSVRREGRWEAPDRLEAEDAFYTHGYCPACLNRALTELALIDLHLASWPAPRPREAVSAR
ncbi:MAG TPA: hypothetical protein P5567_10065 [Kiritimatiellia bacterium]|nr:hypothetical protein [Kiritimatiellia bacterium]HRZ12785.1 hypothetical protein [Kiritimatiellia bacterium]HSA18263.1 hypothetical protein [Kiritimatiellia bacterium]